MPRTITTDPNGLAMRLSTVTPGTTVRHPMFGLVTVVRPLDRGDFTNTAGFGPGVIVRTESDDLETGYAAGSVIPVYAHTMVTPA